MATWPAKINYTTGGILTAAQMNDIGGELNDLYTTAGFAAGKNKIINGDFGIWQRGTSFTGSTGSNTYTADRWVLDADRTNPAFSQQTFTAGTAPVAGYEGTFFARFTPGTGGTFSNIQQKIENVRTLANQIATISYWAKCSTGTIANAPYIVQRFGSGGSGDVNTALSTNTITTTWTRFTHTLTIPSVSGKTIGAGSSLTILPIRVESGTTTTIDIWGVQVEAGSTVTQFQTATGTIQGELAACQRYYYASGSTGNPTSYFTFGNGPCYSTTQANISINFPVMMRTAPSYSATGTINLTTATNGAQATSSTALDAASTTTAALTVTANSAGLVAGNATRLYSVNDANARLQFSAEL